MITQTPLEALNRAIAAFDSVAAFAEALPAATSSPHMWRSRGNVPAEYCPAIERETRRLANERGDPSLMVACEALRPDVDWSALRDPLPELIGQDAPAVKAEAV